VDLDQYLILFGSRPWYLFELENIRRPVSGVDNGFHELPPELL
jgi:hypothetical protein